MPEVAVPTAPPLANLRRVELVQTGDWIISSGRWKAARDDLVAAVAALDCPAVRRPVIKLGHSQGEEPLWQGNPTGAPAIGWIDSLAPTNQGHTLVGDLVGMPGWLASRNAEGQMVIASAWPDRSVEGKYDFRCQIGHTHPFVLTAVALLGVTPPGVGTLRSLQDVGRLYGVQAAGGTVVAFDPDQPRWPDGAPGGLGGQWRDETPDVGGDRKLADLPDAVVTTTVKTAAGPDLVVRSDADGMHLAFGDSRSGALGRRAAERLGELLRLGPSDDDEDDEDDRRITNSAATYTKPGAPTGFVQVTQEGNSFELELLNNDRTVKLTNAEARQLADVVDRYGVARRVDTDSGTVDVWLDGDNIGLRAPADDEGHVELSFTPGDWDKVRRATNMVWEGFDETGEIGEAGRDVTSLRVETALGPLLVSRRGEGDTPTLSIAPEGGGWSVVWPGDWRHPFSDATAWVEENAEGLEIFPFSSTADRKLRGVSVVAAVDVAAHMPGRHNQETHGRRYGPGGNPLRRLTRGGRRNAVSALNRLLRDFRGDEAANRPGMAGGPLVDVVRGVRDGVDDGQFTPDQALTLLSSLVFRPDVASNPRLSTALAEATGRLREGDRRDAPNLPEPVRDVTPEPTAPSPPRAGDNAEFVSRLRSAGSRDEARSMLDGLTVSQLKDVANEANIAFPQNIRKPDLVNLVVQWTVGRRRDSEAISRPAPSRIDAMVQVEAAADVRTGAMVALLPSEEETRRLAVEGGEAAEQLHATVLFLGDADAYPEAARQAIVEEMRALAEVIPPGEVDGMAISAFNPDKPDKDTAIVVELGGDGLEDVYGLVEQAVTDVAAEHGLALPEQHSPYRPHVTLLYSDDLMNVPRLADRAGPVRLDRIRVAFAGENVDIPLAGEANDDPDLDHVTDDDMPVAASSSVEAQQSRRVTRSDAPLRRYWMTGKGSLKIRWGSSGDFGRCVRQLRRYVRDPKGLCATYHRQRTGFWPGRGRHHAASTEEATILPNPNPTIIHAVAQVSVDDVRTAFYRQAPNDRVWIREVNQHPRLQLIVADGPEGTAEVDVDIADDGSIRFGEPVPVTVQYVRRDQVPEEVAASQFVYASAAESRPSTVTSPPTPPGFQPAEPVEPTEPAEEPEPVEPTEPGQVEAAEVSNRPWSDFDESDYSPEQWRRATILDRGESAGDENTKSRYGLPVREPDGTLNRNGVHAAAGGHGIGEVKGISSDLRRSTARKLVRLYDQIGDEPPDSLRELAGTSTSASAADPHQTPAAEPGNPTTMEEEMPLSTEVLQRLGVAEDADQDTVSAAVLAALDKADKAPDPQTVAAAAAEKDELTQEVGLLKGQVEAMSAKLSAVEEEKAATVKASVLDTAMNEGKFAPTDREKWEADYDAAPAVVTRVLASIAPGTAVPVNVQGKVGEPWDVAASEDNLPPEPEWLYGPGSNEPALAGKEN